MSMPYKDWKKVGIKTFEAMLYGSGGSKIKKIKRAIYSQKTNTPRFRIYWFELKKGEWRNTTLKGIRTGIVVSSSEYGGLRTSLGGKK